MAKRFLSLLCAAALVGAAACRSSAPPNVEYRSDVPTEDGLYLSRSAPNHVVYLRPDARIRSYSEVVVDPFTISYATQDGSRDEGPARVRTLAPEDEARLAGLLRSAFIQEMQRSRHFRVVESPGPTALRVQGWLYDLVIEEPYRGDPRNFPLCFGTMNLILNVRDSRSAQSLARVSDRIAISCEVRERGLFYSASWRDVKGALRPWASFLRESLDELHEIPDLPAAPAEPPRARPRPDAPPQG